MKRILAALILCLSLAAPAFPQAPVFRDLAHLVPAGNLQGWCIKGAGARYVSANLYLYINGQAEMYLDYGFQSLISNEYTNEKQPGAVIVVDIYDMQDKDRAMGIYTAEKDESARRIDAGAEGYQSGQVLNFWKGPYYVKISVLGRIADPEGVLPLFARAAAAKIPGDTQPPERALRLKQLGLIDGTLKYLPKSFMGHAFLTNTYSGEYLLPGAAQVRMFISEYPGPGESAAAFTRYRDFARKGSPKVFEELSGFGESAFFYRDPLGKEHIVVRQGKNLCGASGEKLDSAARELLKKIMP